MRKILFVALLAAASVMAYAQPRAIGGRLGGFNGFSYEHSLGENNMIEVEAGFSVVGHLDWWNNVAGVREHGRFWGHNVQAAFTYDWIDPFGAKFPWEHKGEWHWYMGVGATGGFGWDAWDNITATNQARFWGFAGAAGRFGVEYDFWFPLQLSLDYRPVLGAGLYENGGGGANAGLYWEVTGVSLGVRYKF